jgi:hypothetical protein
MTFRVRTHFAQTRWKTLCEPHRRRFVATSRKCSKHQTMAFHMWTRFRPKRNHCFPNQTTRKIVPSMTVIPAFMSIGLVPFKSSCDRVDPAKRIQQLNESPNWSLHFPSKNKILQVLELAGTRFRSHQVRLEQICTTNRLNRTTTEIPDNDEQL